MSKTNNQEYDRYPCPSCGADMVFNIELQALYCKYCDSTVVIEEDKSNILEYDFNIDEKLEETKLADSDKIVKCDNCGAEVILNENITASKCPFCGSAFVVKSENYSIIYPESLITFKINNSRAIDIFKKWISKKIFAPKEIKNRKFINKLKGIYLPYFTYDSRTDSFYTAKAGTYYYVTRTRQVTRNGKTTTVHERVRKIRWRNVSGNYSDFYNDVLVNASSNIKDKHVKEIEPYDLKELTGYKTEYISGFMAEKYSYGISDCWITAKDIVDNELNRKIRNKINADEIRNLRVNTDYLDIKYKHIMLPVWVADYKYKDKKYKFIINGQTGELQGDYPKSAFKIALVIIIALLLTGSIVLFFMFKNNMI